LKNLIMPQLESESTAIVSSLFWETASKFEKILRVKSFNEMKLFLMTYFTPFKDSRLSKDVVNKKNI